MGTTIINVRAFFSPNSILKLNKQFLEFQEEVICLTCSLLSTGIWINQIMKFVSNIHWWGDL